MPCRCVSASADQETMDKAAAIVGRYRHPQRFRAQRSRHGRSFRQQAHNLTGAMIWPSPKSSASPWESRLRSRRPLATQGVRRRRPLGNVAPCGMFSARASVRLWILAARGRRRSPVVPTPSRAATKMKVVAVMDGHTSPSCIPSAVATTAKEPCWRREVRRFRASPEGRLCLPSMPSNPQK